MSFPPLMGKAMCQDPEEHRQQISAIFRANSRNSLLAALMTFLVLPSVLDGRTSGRITSFPLIERSNQSPL